MYRSEYIVCFRSEISFVPLLFSHRTPFLRPYWQIYFNSTSNHNTLQNYHNAYGVVSYFNSTSNHNSPVRELSRRGVVSYFNSTSNHNSPSNRVENMRLFLISILHQTTTEQADVHISPRCFLFQFYIKPQLRFIHLSLSGCCFLFQFYIKPQPRICDLLIVIRLCGRMNGTNGA